jgi:iron complex outermembrane receptor protein
MYDRLHGDSSVRPALRSICAIALLLVPASMRASGTEGTPVSGQVQDRENHPIGGALVSIPELHRAAITDENGSFRLGNVPRGHYTVVAHKLGFVATSIIVDVGALPVTLALSLEPGAARIEPVNVTATRVPVAGGASPLSTSILTGEQVHVDGGVSLAHSLARLPGVRNVSTGQQIGKPMIRGLFGPRILVLTDGSRLEDYSWSDEDAPSLDARIAERVEVIRGPASVLYGSEALGGIVNVIPPELAYSSDGTPQRHEGIELSGGSNNLEMGGALNVDGARSRYAWRAMGTGRFSQNYQTPNGAVPNSSFWAFNGEGAFGVRRDNGGTTVRGAHYGGEFHLLEALGPEAADPSGGPVRQVLDDRVQITDERLFGGIRLETKAQYQRHSLTEVSDDCVPALGQTTCVKVKDRPAFSLLLNTGTVDVLAHHGSPAGLWGTVGVNGMYQTSGSTGPIFLVPGASINSAAAFAFEQLRFGAVTFVAGARGDTRHLTSDAQAEIQRGADSRSWSAASGDVGLVVALSHNLTAVANVGTGWRSPTIFDLYANGPNLAEARFEIGDPSLRTERARSLDGALRWASDAVHAEVAVFNNNVDDFIFTTPTGTLQNGLRIFRHTQADARLTGMEASIEARVADPLTLRASHDFVNGVARATDVPLPLMAAPRTTVGAEVALGDRGALHRVRLGTDLEVHERQTHLNPTDLATAGYSLVNLDLSFEHPMRSRPVRFDVLVRNALNTTYRDFLSRFKEFADGPGVNVMIKASAGVF